MTTTFIPNVTSRLGYDETLSIPQNHMEIGLSSANKAHDTNLKTINLHLINFAKNIGMIQNKLQMADISSQNYYSKTVESHTKNHSELKERIANIEETLSNHGKMMSEILHILEEIKQSASVKDNLEISNELQESLKNQFKMQIMELGNDLFSSNTNEMKQDEAHAMDHQDQSEAKEELKEEPMQDEAHVTNHQDQSEAKEELKEEPMQDEAYVTNHQDQSELKEELKEEPMQGEEMRDNMKQALQKLPEDMTEKIIIEPIEFQGDDKEEMYIEISEIEPLEVHTIKEEQKEETMQDETRVTNQPEPNKPVNKSDVYIEIDENTPLETVLRKEAKKSIGRKRNIKSTHKEEVDDEEETHRKETSREKISRKSKNPSKKNQKK